MRSEETLFRIFSTTAVDGSDAQLHTLAVIPPGPKLWVSTGWDGLRALEEAASGCITSYSRALLGLWTGRDLPPPLGCEVGGGAHRTAKCPVSMSRRALIFAYDAVMMIGKRSSSVLADFRPFTICPALVITAPSSP